MTKAITMPSIRLRVRTRVKDRLGIGLVLGPRVWV